MGAEAFNRGGHGGSVSLLWLLLLPALATRGLRASLPCATPALAPGVEDGAAAPSARPLGAVCGKPKVTGRIFGGRDAVAGQWPWQASLLHRHLHICGAVLIDPHWLVSTAHCFLNKSRAPEDYQVLLGSTRLYQHAPPARTMAVSRIITHPDFEKSHPFGNDIAMLQLRVPVNFTSYISPACLPSAGLPLSCHWSCWITGWGMLSEDSHLLPPFPLQEGRVTLLDSGLCAAQFAQRLGRAQAALVHEEMLCAGDFLTGRAICRGDSGGPLVCDLLGSWVLVGLASWGLDCQHPIHPSVFTSVVHFADWIGETQRLTPLPEPSSAHPQTRAPHRPPHAAGTSGPRPALLPPQTWVPLLPVLVARGQALR